MAQSQQHINQWKHNRAFLGTIPRDYPDWIVTVSFYVALHAVEALLTFDKVQVTTHDQRNFVLGRTNRYQAIRRAYAPLYSLCRTVRYLADPLAWVPADQIEKNVFERYLYPIEKSVQNLINKELGLPKIKLVAAASSSGASGPVE